MRKLICLSVILAMGSVAAAQHLRLLTYNIRNAKGMDNQTNYDRIAGVIKNEDADIVALQELDSVTKRNSVYVAKLLAEKTHMHHTYASAISYQGGKYGVGILSKKKPRRYYKIALPGKEEERVLLVAEFKKYVIFCTHLSLTENDRNTSVEIINKESAKFSKPIYLLGDLNAEPNSSAIHLLKQTWILLTDEASTFPADAPSKCIDYIFSRNNKRTIISNTVINEPVASDHRPVLVELKK